MRKSVQLVCWLVIFAKIIALTTDFHNAVHLATKFWKFAPGWQIWENLFGQNLLLTLPYILK